MQDRETESETANSLLRALRNTAVSVIRQDSDLKVIWAHNVPLIWASGDIVGLTDADFLPKDTAELVMAEKRAAIAKSSTRRLELHIPARNRHDDKWFDLWIDLDGATGGKPVGIVTTVVETTAQKQREQTLRVLLREVSHRSRNLLAIIQSIAVQTGNYTTTVDSFMRRFRGRLQSLASSQDLVTSSNWRGADLGDLALGQASRYLADPRSALKLEGESPWLSPNAALHIGLALHELIANSVSYGALSRPGGKAFLHAAYETGADGDASLRMVWSEDIHSHAAASSDAKNHKRFGSVALERVVPASLNGSAQLIISGDALEYSLLVPPGHFEPA